MLNEQQLKLVNSRSPRLVGLAAPGSGKTRVLVARVARLIEEGHDSIVVLTYTVAAAGEILHRVKATQPNAEGAIEYIGTLHGFCLKRLKSAASFVGLEGTAILPEDLRKSMIAEAVQRCRYKGTAAVLQDAIQRFPFSEKPVFPSPEWATAAAYHSAMKESGFVDFDAILSYTLLLFRKFRQLPTVHLLVDELQDASEIDGLIYDALNPVNLFAIGDVNQAIYGFRGGSADYLLRLAKAHDCHRLETNYRCAGSICDVADRLIAHNKATFKARNIPPDTAPEGLVAFLGFETQEVENESVAQHIQGILKLQPAQCLAVLCRTNHHAAAIREALARRGVLVAPHEADRLPEGWDSAISLLSLHASPDNEALAYHELCKDLGTDTANKIREKATAEGKSLFDASLRVRVPNSGLSASGVLAKAGFDQALIAAVDGLAVAMGGCSLTELVLQLRSTLTLAPRQAKEGEVEVLTMHRSKGREWDHVILPGWCAANFPKGKTGPEIEEERRLAYVAITRAKFSVLITSPMTMKTNDWQLIEMPGDGPSRFIGDIDPGIMEAANLARKAIGSKVLRGR